MARVIRMDEEYGHGQVLECGELTKFNHALGFDACIWNIILVWQLILLYLQKIA